MKNMEAQASNGAELLELVKEELGNKLKATKSIAVVQLRIK